VEGSGTTLLVGVVVAKQVGPVAHKSLATWTFPTVIPVEISAFVRTKVNELAVALPVVPKQVKVDLLPIPPHAPKDSEPVLTPVIIEVPLTFMFPENPMTGPPSLTVFEPDIEMSTQTEVASAVQPPVPPWVRVSVPTWVEPKNKLSLMLSAQRAGAIANVAVMASADIKNFVFRTAVLLYFLEFDSAATRP
jgi:hypothetical protein